MSSVLPDAPAFQAAVNAWMVPAMLDGARFAARVASRHEQDTASWRRLLITIRRG